MFALSKKKGKARMIPNPTKLSPYKIQKLVSNAKNIDVDFPLLCHKPIVCVFCCHYVFNCIDRTEPSLRLDLNRCHFS